MSDGTVLLRVEGVTKRFTKGPHVVVPLDDVSLNIMEGSFVALLGPSGSGKTTLLNLLAGIDHPSAGTITMGQTVVSALKGRALARWRAEHVGTIFQQYHLVPVLNAYENVELPLHLFGLSRKERHARVTVALDAVGLGDRGHHFPKELSGGQEQRVAIARALVADPDLLVADEPTGNLDRESAEAVMDLLGRLVAERGKTLVMVTHDEAAAQHASRILRLDKGRFLEETTA